MNFSRAIITGGAGFIGSELVDELIRQEKEVLVVDNLRSGSLENLKQHEHNPNFYFEKKDICSAYLHTIFKEFKPEVVFHLAAIPGVVYSVENPTETNEINVQGTLNLLELSKKHQVQRFIFSSSSSVYGGAEILPTPETHPLQPKSPYALQKKIGEEYCQLYAKTSELDTVSLRYFNVIGTRQKLNSAYAAIIPAFIDAIKKEERPIIYGDGEQSRDFCPVKNVVQANLLAANHHKKLSGRSFNIACGSRTSINSLARLIGTLLPRYYSERPGDIRHSCADISKAQEVLNYQIIQTFEDALKEILKTHLIASEGIGTN